MAAAISGAGRLLNYLTRLTRKTGVAHACAIRATRPAGRAVAGACDVLARLPGEPSGAEAVPDFGALPTVGTLIPGSIKRTESWRGGQGHSSGAVTATETSKTRALQ